MKRFLSFLLFVAVLINAFCVLSFAANEESSASTTAATTGNGYVADGKIGDVSSCLYDPESKKVSVSGVIDHGVMVTHDSYRIALYSVSEGQTLGEILESEDSKPLASAAISVKFDFVVDAKTNAERFSKYAVVIYNGKGDVKLIEEPKYPSVKSSYTYEIGNKSNYKGVSTELTSSAVDAGAATVIVPVYLEKLLSSGSTGYVYPLQGSYIYFDKGYIGELDVRIKSATAVGSRVYLQFLLSSGADCGIMELDVRTDYGYEMPDMSSEQTVNLISAFTSFLCDRYNSNNLGRIDGIILGRKVDSFSTDTSDVTLDGYAENYFYYMLVIGSVARAYLSDIDIVMPLSDKNDYFAEDNGSADPGPAILLAKICGLLDTQVVNLFPFSTLVETESVPYGVLNELLGENRSSAVEYDGINADNTELYANYLKVLGEKYDNAPNSFIFVWSVSKGISGNLLSCTYAYSYFKLLANDEISSFVVSFTDIESDSNYGAFPEIAKIFKYIDTKDSFSATADQLKLLGAGNWYAVIDGMYSGRVDRKRILALNALGSVPDNIIGSYSYYDFSYYTNLSLWFKGNDCDSLKIDYNDVSGRSLEAHFNGALGVPSEYSEIFCSYDYPENLVFTPYLSFKFSFESDDGNKDSLYEIKIVIGSDDNTAEVSRVCRGYEAVDLMLDVSAFNEISMVEYVKIGVRRLTAEPVGYSLSLASIKGYSANNTSDELEQLISNERLRIRDLLKEEGDTSQMVSKVLIGAGVIAVVAVIGIGIFMCFKREEEE